MQGCIKVVVDYNICSQYISGASSLDDHLPGGFVRQLTAVKWKSPNNCEPAVHLLNCADLDRLVSPGRLRYLPK